MNTKDTPPKKKRTFFNQGRGFNPEDFDMDISRSPPISPSGSERSNSSECLVLSQRGVDMSQPRHATFNRALIAPSAYDLHPSYSPHMGYQPLSPCSSTPFSEGVPTSYFNQAAHYAPLALGPAAAIGATAALTSAYAADPYMTSCLSTRRFVTPGWATSSDRNSRCEDSRDDGSSDQPHRKRQQKCSLCFNHGIIKEKKGHKWQCNYRNCDCPRCIITIGRQRTMRDQQKLTRHLQKMQL